MSKIALSLLVMFSCSTVFGQGAPATAGVLEAPATLPIVFVHTISAARSHPGDAVSARTTQDVHLADGEILRRGAKITGHVVQSKPFAFDETLYARQKASVLSIRFDSIEVGGKTVPLDVTVRAIADPLTSLAAVTPEEPDVDPWGAVTQIGGDRRYLWPSPIFASDGNIVAYTRNNGVYAHLIASGACDASSVEVSIGIYSPSACGVYGFADTATETMGTQADPSTLTLVSTRHSPKVWKNSTALLEILPQGEGTDSRQSGS